MPPPADFIERHYSDSFYPALQASLTSWSNETSFSLFDLLLMFLIVLVVSVLARSLRASIGERSLRPAGRGLLTASTIAAAMYLWFLAAWGLNYARQPIELAIGYDGSRVSAAALAQLAERAVAEANAAHAAAHAAGFPQHGDVPAALVTSLHQVERRLGRTVSTTPGRPKRTLLAAFFRAAGVDGMHAPFLLETLLNPDLTAAERPAVVAHEWAHMSGYAPEDDASFVGLMAALGADPPSRYSAWLTLLFDASGQLPAGERQRVMAKLGPGPRADQQLIAERIRRSRVEVVQRASWETYDRYLKVQGVREGIRSYSRVVQLVIGSNALAWAAP